MFILAERVLLVMVLFATSLNLYSQDKVALSADSIPITYEVYGEATPALVFVHGWSCDRSYWKEQVKPFSFSYKVVAIDLAGHGTSGKGRKDYTMESFGADVEAVVKKLGLKQVILIGHSMGGDVIAEAALRLPGSVKGLIMIDTYKKLGAGRTPAEVELFIKKLRNNFPDSARAFVRSMFPGGTDPSLVESIAEDMSSAPPEIALNALENAFHYSRQITRTLEKLKLPTIAINPDNSPTDIKSMERFGVKVLIIKGVGHFPLLEDPVAFNPLLEEAIKRIAR